MLLSALLAALGCSPEPKMTLRDEGRLGSVRIFASVASTRGVAFLFSDADGWKDDWTQSANRLARDGALVVGVDLPSYLRGLRASDDGCHYVISEIEDLGQRLEREHGFDHFHAPILTGLGEGGTLAYAALAQSPAATVDGAISIDPKPVLTTRVALCAGAPSRAAQDGGFRYEARSDLQGHWWVSSRSAMPAPLEAIAEEPDVDLALTAAPLDRLEALVRAAIHRNAGGEASLEDLPLTELPVPGSPTQMAVIYSGDGGWRDLDKDIAGVLAREGTPVVGVDSLRYFWREKTPAEVASDLVRILRRFRARWRVERVLLIGYSFGANILPFAVEGLPSRACRRICEKTSYRSRCSVSLDGRRSRSRSRDGWASHRKDSPFCPSFDPST